MEQKRELEAQGQDVEAAIAAALLKAGKSRDDVTIEVLDRGSRGLLGIGARDAVVRLTWVVTIADPPPPQPPKTTPPPAPVKPAPVVTPAPAAKPTPSPRPQSAPVQSAPPAAAPAPVKAAVELAEGERDEAAELAQEQATAVTIITELLAKMRVEATVEASLSAPDDLTGRRINVIQIYGQDMSSLIGPRGDTLSALQYISRLMVGHRLQQRADFVIDVEGYRQRREQALVRLAERTAQKVAKRGQAMSLEPMPPNERRIIHVALRDDKDVYTESTGEGNRRKVRIIPKR
jgi:spoIIIJ-associated protein